MPDLAAVHQGLKRKNVTLALLWEEYVRRRPGRPTSIRASATSTGTSPRASSARCARCTAPARSSSSTMRATRCRSSTPRPARFSGADLRGRARGLELHLRLRHGHAVASRLAGALGRALRFIGGVPELIVPDNTAPGGEPDRYAPQLQRTTAEFAQHYGVAILPARPYKPQDKSKVEVGVQIVQRWILARLRHRRFFSLAELDVAIAELL